MPKLFKKFLGHCIAKCLSKTDSGGFGRFLSAVDDRFNLHYLADRLTHEQRVIDQYLGDVNQLSEEQSNLISIVTPVYGIRNRYIKTFIRSVQKQSYKNWELCICIDGDPDEKVHRYFKLLNKVDPDRYKLIIHEQNQGICAATESALTLISGEIVAFSDADDVLHKDALAAVAKAFASDEDIDFVYTNNDILTPWGYRIDPVYKPGWSPELLLSCNYIVHFVVVRHSLLEKLGQLWGSKLNGAQDWNLLFQAGKKAKKIHHIPIVLYHWRAHENSMAGTCNSKPWAFDAATNVLQTHLHELNEDLYFDWNNNIVPAPIRFKDNKCPPLYVIEVFINDESQIYNKDMEVEYEYPGRVDTEKIFLKGDLESKAAQLNKCALNIDKRDSILLFVCKDLYVSKLMGELETQAVFSSLPNVSCVWPYYHEYRGNYTINDQFLVPRIKRTSFFTKWTSNVLTGPLHGLMIKQKALKQLGGIQISKLDVKLKDQSIHLLGALLGLYSQERGYRNVAVRTVTCDWSPPKLEVGTLSPNIDPYI